MDQLAESVQSFFDWFAASDGASGSLLWSADPHVQFVLACVLSLALAAVVFVYVPFGWRLLRVGRLRREIAGIVAEDDAPSLPAQRGRIDDAFLRSPLAPQWETFLARWRGSVVSDGHQELAPVRLADVFEESPPLPVGARRSLLPALAGLFLAAGTLGALVAIALAIPSASQVLDLDAEVRVAELASSIEMALRTALWGLLLSMAAAVCSRTIEGRTEKAAEALDQLVGCAYGFAAGERALPGGGGDLARMRGELAQMMDARFAVQAASIRGLHEVVLSSAREPEGGDPNATEANTATIAQAASEIRSASQSLSSAALEVDSKLDALRSLSASLEESARRDGGDDQAQLTLIDEGLARVTASIGERLDPIHQRLMQLGSDLASAAAARTSGGAEDMAALTADLRAVAAEIRASSSEAVAPARSEDHAIAQREQIEHGLARVTASIAERLDPIHQRLVQLGSELASVAGAPAPLAAEAKDMAALTADLRAVAGEIRETLSEAVAPSQSEEDLVAQRELIDTGFERMSAALREGFGPLEQRLEQLGSELAAGSDSGVGEQKPALEAVAADLRGVADELRKSLGPAQGLMAELDQKTGNFFTAVGDLEAHVERAELSVGELRSGVSEEGRQVRAAAEALEQQIVRITEALKSQATATPDAVVPTDQSEHERNVEKALERARAVKAASSQPPPGTETVMAPVPPLPTKDPDARDTVRVRRARPPAASDPEGARPPGLSSLLSSKRPTADDD